MFILFYYGKFIREYENSNKLELRDCKIIWLAQSNEFIKTCENIYLIKQIRMSACNAP